MKRLLPTIGALAVLAGLAAFLLWGPEPGAAPAAQTGEAAELITLHRDAVRTIAVQGDGFTLRLRRETRAVGEQNEPRTVWLIQQADGVELTIGEGLAEESAVGRFLSACCPLRGARQVEAQPSDLAQYGLAEPRWTVSLNGGEVVLHVGDYNQPAGGHYAQLEGDEAVYLIPSAVGSALPEEGRDWVRPAE